MENGNCSTVVQQNGMVVVQNGLDEDKYIKLVLLVNFCQLEAYYLPMILYYIFYLFQIHYANIMSMILVS